MIDEDALKRIEELHRLQKEGIISEEEFEKSKQSILFDSKPARKIATAQTAGPTSAVSTNLPDPENWFDWMMLPIKRYTQFTGRSSRKEYWLFMLAHTALFLFCAIWSVPLGAEGAAAIYLLVLLGLLVPTLAVQVRRFHDQDKSGWFALMNLIPYIGWLIVFVFMVLEGTKGDNRFGPDPTL